MNSRRVQYYGFEANGVEGTAAYIVPGTGSLQLKIRNEALTTYLQLK